MRDINRIDKFCDELKDIWKKNPDLRFGQLIDNVLYRIKSEGGVSFYMEDEEMLNSIKNFYKVDE